MIEKLIAPILFRLTARLTVTMLGALLCLEIALARPFTVQGPGVNSNDFRITTFASGLDVPLGMAQLSDGSLLVAISRGANLFNSSGNLVRLTFHGRW